MELQEDELNMSFKRNSNSNLRNRRKFRKSSNKSRSSSISSRRSEFDENEFGEIEENSEIELSDPIVLKSTPIERAEQLGEWALGDLIKIIQQPHTLIMLMVIISYIIYEAFIRTPSVELYDNIGRGIKCASILFIIYGILQFPDMITKNPHPAIWKAAHCIGIIYTIFLTILLILPADNARQLMKIIDPSLGVPLEERLYATDCRVYTPEQPHMFQNIYNCINDEFFIAHFVGWIVKALMIRDWGILWAQSLIFEVLEITFQYALPNFNECWWDHYIIDVLICNYGGMAIGMWLVNKFATHKYVWVSEPKVPKKANLLQKFLLKFTPLSWTVYDWDIFQSFKRWMQTVTLVVIFELCEISAFTLKYGLWIPPTHIFNTLRLMLYAAVGFVGIREYYEFTNNKTVKKIGPNAWLVLICVVYI